MEVNQHFGAKWSQRTLRMGEKRNKMEKGEKGKRLTGLLVNPYSSLQGTRVSHCPKIEKPMTKSFLKLNKI